MNKGTKLIVKTLAAASVFLAVGFVGSKADILPTNCDDLPVIGPDYGCVANTSCGFLQPNDRTNWLATLRCCYRGDKSLLSQEIRNCHSTLSGCCNGLDGAMHCPEPTGCPNPRP